MESLPQHPAGPRRVKRVHELAAELGVSSKTVLATLKAMGAFVMSASSSVDPRTAERLRQALRTGRSPYGITPTDSAETQADTPKTDVPQVPLTGLAKTLRGTFPELQSDEEARRLADAWTADGLFTDHDVIAWCRAGLSPRGHAQARHLQAHGVRPEHLDLVIQGRSVKSLLRGGQSVTQVIGLLHSTAHIAP